MGNSNELYFLACVVVTPKTVTWPPQIKRYESQQEKEEQGEYIITTQIPEYNL